MQSETRSTKLWDCSLRPFQCNLRSIKLWDCSLRPFVCLLRYIEELYAKLEHKSHVCISIISLIQCSFLRNSFTIIIIITTTTTKASYNIVIDYCTRSVGYDSFINKWNDQRPELRVSFIDRSYDRQTCINKCLFNPSSDIQTLL